MSNLTKIPDTASVRPPTPVGGATTKSRVDLDSRFHWGRLLGRGSYADVVLVTEKDPPNIPYAMKVIDKRQIKSKHQMQELLREIRIMRVVRQQHIVRLYEVFETERKVYLQMEYVSGGELFDRITAPGRDSLPELESRSIVHQILSAVAYLHRHDIVHRDLKPENILTSGDEEKIVVKIADFGLANLLQNDRTRVMKTQCGSFPYVAPEVLKSNGYGKEVDMWAIGVITYVLVSGFFPFNADDDAHMLRTILACKWTFFSPAFDHVTQAAKDFIARLIVADPQRRMTADQALKHRWFHPHATEDAQLFDLVLGENAHDHSNLHHSPAWAQDPEKHAQVDEIIEKIQKDHNWVGLDTEIDHEGVPLVWPAKGQHYAGEKYQELQNTLQEKRKERDVTRKPNAHETAQALLRQMNQTGQLPPRSTKQPQSAQPSSGVQGSPNSPQSAPAAAAQGSPNSPQNAPATAVQVAEVPMVVAPAIEHPRPQATKTPAGWTTINAAENSPSMQPRTSSLGPRTPSPQPSARTHSSGLSTGKAGGGFLYKLFHPKSVEQQRAASDASSITPTSSMESSATLPHTIPHSRNIAGGMTTSLPHSLDHQGVNPISVGNKTVLMQTYSPGRSSPQPTNFIANPITNLMQNLRNTMAGHKKLKLESLDQTALNSTSPGDFVLASPSTPGRVSPLNPIGTPSITSITPVPPSDSPNPVPPANAMDTSPALRPTLLNE